MQKINVALLGEQWQLDARKACYWPMQRCLIVADLHLEKARALAPEYQLPQYDSYDTLAKLEVLINDYQPKRVICLGDSFHTATVAKHLPKNLLKKLNSLVEKIDDWIWVLGNHDPELPDEIMGNRCEFIRFDTMTFTHEPLDFTQYSNQICGHFHPKSKVSVGLQKVSGACFVANEELMILPSLGSFTGGLSIDDKAITEYISKKSRQIYMIANEKIWALK